MQFILSQELLVWHKSCLSFYFCICLKLVKNYYSSPFAHIWHGICTYWFNTVMVLIWSLSAIVCQCDHFFFSVLTCNLQHQSIAGKKPRYKLDLHTHNLLKCTLRFSISSCVRSWDPSKDLSFLVLKKTVLVHTLAMAAARSLRRALKLCSRETISASIWSCLAESPMTHRWSRSCFPDIYHISICMH